MFLFQFFGKLAQDRGFEFYSANSDPPREFDGQSRGTDFCCCPVRTFEIDSAIESEFEPQRIFHVRDPRDMLVSEYFSFGWRHTSEGSPLDDRREAIQKMTVDQYVLQQPEFSSWPLEKKFQPLLERIATGESARSHDIVVKYETMVTEFPTWVAAVIQPFGYRLPRIAARKWAWKYRNEFRPSAQPQAHKRKVTPGDFRDKLKRETIEVLNDRFADALERFGYDK